MIRPLFSFYGAKWRLAPRYPAPRFGTIVEPFAGSAGYACRYPDRAVILVERDPMIAAVWRFLIGASRADIESIPFLDEGADVSDLAASQEARWLVGFWLNKATSAPRRHMSKWGRERPWQFWGPEVRARVAADAQAIKHWRVIEGSYADAPHVKATWFVDPPYRGATKQSRWTGGGAVVSAPAGDRYRFGAKRIDFGHLGGWCRSRQGQVIVCEGEGASWLPFRSFHAAKGQSGKSAEVVWLSDDALVSIAQTGGGSGDFDAEHAETLRVWQRWLARRRAA